MKEDRLRFPPGGRWQPDGGVDDGISLVRLRGEVLPEG
jgi:hypothetical protein